MGYMMSREQAFMRNSERYHRRLRAAGHDYEAVKREQQIAHLEDFVVKYADVAAFEDARREVPERIANVRAAGPVGCSCSVCEAEAAAP